MALTDIPGLRALGHGENEVPDAPTSPAQRLVSAVYGNLPAMSEESASALGLCSRILVLAERSVALLAKQAQGQMTDPSTARYADWVRQELSAAINRTGRVDGMELGPAAVQLRVRGALVDIPVSVHAIEQLIEEPRLWERDVYYVGTPEFLTSADAELQTRIARELATDDSDNSEEARYDQGYRDALQIVLLAAVRAGVTLDACRDLATTAFDAYANNAPELTRARP